MNATDKENVHLLVDEELEIFHWSDSFFEQVFTSNGSYLFGPKGGEGTHPPDDDFKGGTGTETRYGPTTKGGGWVRLGTNGKPVDEKAEAKKLERAAAEEAAQTAALSVLLEMKETQSRERKKRSIRRQRAAAAPEGVGDNKSPKRCNKKNQKEQPPSSPDAELPCIFDDSHMEVDSDQDY